MAMTEHDARRFTPIKQQTLDTLPEDFRVSFSVSTSTVDTLLAIYLNEFLDEGENSEVGISPEQLFQSFRGQQLHVLNELMIMVVREVKRFYKKVSATFSSSELTLGDILLPVKLVFTPKLIKSYFSEMKADELVIWSKIINARIEEYPEIQPGSDEYVQLELGKKRVRSIKSIDIPQLIFDVWNDWRFNQTFSIKRGILQNPDKNANYFEMANEILRQNTLIWEDGYPSKKNEIELDAIETLAAWRVILSNPKVWETTKKLNTELEPAEVDNTFVSLLLDLKNRIRFEQLINIRYLIDEKDESMDNEAILSAYISGQPDIIVLIPTPDGGLKTVLGDIKSTLRNNEGLETLITQMQAKVAPWIKPGAKSPWIIMASELAEADLSEIEIIHINPLSIIQLAAGTFDFEFQIQQTFNTYNDRTLFQALIQDATLHPKKYKDRILRHKRQNRVPVKHTFANELQPIERRVLPTLKKELQRYFEDAAMARLVPVQLTNEHDEEAHRQMSLPGIERAAIKTMSAKTRHRLKRKTA